MKIRSKNIDWGNVIAASLMGVCLILALIGMFVNFAKLSATSTITYKKLFELKGAVGISTIVFALLSIVSTTAITALAAYTAITNNELKVANIVILVLSIMFSLTFGILSSAAVINLTEALPAFTNAKYSLAVGSYLIFFGTILIPMFGVVNKIFRDKNVEEL